jgi:hypothetical protein
MSAPDSPVASGGQPLLSLVAEPPLESGEVPVLVVVVASDVSVRPCVVVMSEVDCCVVAELVGDVDAVVVVPLVVASLSDPSPVIFEGSKQPGRLIAPPHMPSATSFRLSIGPS